MPKSWIHVPHVVLRSHRQGEYVDAELMLEKCESILVTALGHEHPLLANVFISRAHLMQQQVHASGLYVLFFL